jgi:methylmalonyl-CoA/ethylmalonyl-CoA epimerase
MIGRLNHVAIAVPDLDAAAAKYRDLLGAEVGAPQVLAEHGVTVVFVALPNSKVELMQPFGPESPIAKFLEKNPGGGIHHLCFEVNDLADAAARLVAGGARLAGDGKRLEPASDPTRTDVIPAKAGISVFLAPKLPEANGDSRLRGNDTVGLARRERKSPTP